MTLTSPICAPSSPRWFLCVFSMFTPCFFSYIFTALCHGFPGWSHSQLCCFIVPENTFIIIRVYIQICGLENIVIILTQYVPFPQSLLLTFFSALAHEHPATLKTAHYSLPWWGPGPVLATFSSSGYFAREPSFLWGCFTECETTCIIFLSILRYTLEVHWPNVSKINDQFLCVFK